MVRDRAGSRALLALAIVGLLLAAGLGVAVFVFGWEAWYLVAALVLLLGAVALLRWRRRRPAVTGLAPRLDLGRLRPGPLRDQSLYVQGYYRQFELFAAALPARQQAAILGRELPRAVEALRVTFDLCIALQAYQLGESAPVALAGRPEVEREELVAGAEAALDGLVAAFRDGYGSLRTAWRGERSRGRAAAAGLAPLGPAVARVQEFLAIFAPASTPDASAQD